MTKGITIATAKAVAAGNSARQEDIIHTANLSRKAISDMLTTCKVFFFFLPTNKEKEKVIFSHGRSVEDTPALLLNVLRLWFVS